MKVVTISVTEPGRRVAELLPYEHVHGDPGATLASRWSETDAFVVVLALGAVVRLVAPLLDDKATDPPSCASTTRGPMRSRSAVVTPAARTRWRPKWQRWWGPARL
jgi:hypothetical protein